MSAGENPTLQWIPRQGMFPKPPWEAFPFLVCCSCQYSWRRISGSPVCPSSEGSGCVVAPFVSHLWLSLPLAKDFTKPVPIRGFSPKIQIPDPSWSQGPFLGVSPEAVAPRAPVPGWAPLGQDRDRPHSPTLRARLQGMQEAPVTSPHPIPHPKGNGHTFTRKFWPFPNVRQNPGGLWFLPV